MTDLFTYLLKAAIINAVILAFYYFTLRKANKFRVMRFVLLASMLLPLILPLIPIGEVISATGKSVLPVLVINMPLQTNVTQPSGLLQYLSFSVISEILYYLVLLIFLFGMIISVISIFKKRFNADKYPTEFGNVLLEKTINSPFSFFEWVFMSHSYLNHPQLNMLLKHEFTHVKEKHSIDRIISALFRTILWFSPFAHITSNLLTDVHEYQADESVIKEHISRSEYSDLIFSFYLSPSTTRGIANNFSFHVKKRILMINNFNTARINLTRVMTGLCLSFLFITLTAMVRTGNKNVISQTIQEEIKFNLTPGDTVPPAPDITEWVKEIGRKSPEGLAGQSVISFWVESDGTIQDYTVSKSAGEILDKWAIDYMKIINYWRPAQVNGKPVRYQVNIPFEFSSDGNARVKLLKGGAIISQDLTDKDQKPEEDRGPLYPGGDEARISYITKNVVYPEDARKSGKEGTVYVQFIITDKGKVTEAKVLKGVYPSIDKVALDVVAKMPDWKPAIKNGKPVSFEMTVPIKFSLSDVNKEKTIKEADKSHSIKENTVNNDNKQVHDIFTEVEVPPQFPGGEEARVEYFQKNIKYPETTKDGLEGTVYISFIVKPDGSITDAKVIRGIGGGLDEIALSAVSNMPKWIPGKVHGKDVAVQFNMPVKFKLHKEKESK